MKSLALIVAICLAGLPSTVIANVDLPVDGPITSTVGWRIDPFGNGNYSFHRGIDIAVAEGTPVRATRAGKIVFSGRHGDYGNTVIIEHDGGARTLYAHNKSLSAQVGQVLSAGDVIALSGSSGRSTGPHVHYEELPPGQASAVLAMVPGKENVHAALRARMRLDEQLDVIMNSFVNTVRSGLPPTDPPVGG
jgi:murein DD-endopeptidase MepM/ murein hydrolase activator NlpD